MIVLDTHVWIWWSDQSAQLPADFHSYLQAREPQGLGVSAISCWEIAMLVAHGRIRLACPVDQWLRQALLYPGIALLPLTPAIAVESTQLVGGFHKDPADRIIVATARILDCPLVTMDQAIRAYPHVRVAP